MLPQPAVLQPHPLRLLLGEVRQGGMDEAEGAGGKAELVDDRIDKGCQRRSSSEFTIDTRLFDANMFSMLTESLTIDTKGGWSAIRSEPLKGDNAYI